MGTSTGSRSFFIVAASVSSGSASGFIRGLGPETSDRLGYLRGLEDTSGSRTFFLSVMSSGSSSRSGFVSGLEETSSGVGGYIYSYSSGSSGRLSFIRGAGTSSSGSVRGYLYGEAEVLPEDRLLSPAMDLGENASDYIWYYDWSMSLYNDASSSVYSRSASSLEELMAAPWSSASMNTSLSTPVNRYHQLAFDITAYEPNTFVLHQVTVKASIYPGNVTGIVTNSDTGAPVSSALVSLNGWGSATTDISGEYRFDRVPAGTYTMRIRKSLYTTQTLTITVIDGLTTHQNVSLAPQGVEA